MANNISISIIIPTYNRLWCLPRAINSCRNTKCNTEIIVVDDGSTDGTWQWLQNQQNIIAIRQDNQGQTYAINKGCSVARGKYIRFLDSDDFLHEDIIDRQYQKAVETGAELICSRVDGYDESSSEITVNPDLDNWNDFLEIQLSNKYGSHFLGMLFASDLVKAVPRRPDFAFREDRMFLLGIGLLNPKMALVEGCAGYWVKHDAQMQGNYTGLKAQVVNWQQLQIYKRILGVLHTEGRLTDIYRKSACTVLWPLAHWIAKTDITEAGYVASWVMELDPAFKIPEKGVLGFMYKKLGFKLTEKLLRFRRLFK